MDSKKLEKIIHKIDLENSKDPNIEINDGKEIPKELLYSQRMTEKLLSFISSPSFELQIAARAQHICRWEIKRKDYPMDRVGYFNWRNDLKKFHSEKTKNILIENNILEEIIQKITVLIEKKQMRLNTEVQVLEDVICLVFLEYYFDDFSKKHTEEKLISIVKKTWGKMSNKAKDEALKINFSDENLQLIKKAIS